MPPVQRWRIHRKRIVERIRLSESRRVGLLVAGAGFGKSTALRQSLDADAGDVFYRVAPDTGTLLAFVRGLTDALEDRVPSAHLSLAIAYERAAAAPSPATELARWLAEHLREAALRIVIDDLHHATAGEVPDFLRKSIEATSQHVRWLLATRDASALPLASWLAYGICDLPIGEEELRFTRDELAELAAQAAPGLRSEQLDEIASWSESWPSAAALALALGNDGLPPPGATALERYRSLAARFVDAMTEPQRTALFQSSIFADVPAGTALESAYADDLGNGSLRYDNLFREFLLERLRADGGSLERATLAAAAGAAMRDGDARTALVFYQRAAMPQAVGRILAEHGVALLDGRFADDVEAALDTLDRAGFDGGAPVMLLKAIHDARLVRFDSAEAWFQLAITAAGDDDVRLRIVHRYALDLLRRGRVDAIGVLERELTAAPAGHEYQPLLRATLATAYAFVDRYDDARAAIESAMTELRTEAPPALRTRAFHQAAYVALRCADIPAARDYADRVLKVAVPNGYYDLAARAHSILYEIEHVWEVNPERALMHIDDVAAYGMKSGDAHHRQWALLAAYYIEAERGNAEMMSTIEHSLNAPDALQTTGDTSATLLPGQALRATWSGDFAHAYRLLAQSAEGLVSSDRRALRGSEIALFSAAAGLAAEARSALETARAELAKALPNKFTAQAGAYLLISLSLLHDPSAWSEMRRSLSDGARALQAGAFLLAAESLQRHWFEASDYQAVLAALDALHDAGFGGIAAMIAELPAADRGTLAC